MDDYTLFGFCSTSAEPPQPLCFLCGKVFSNNSVKPSHLRRHFTAKHKSCEGKTEDFFRRRLAEFRGSQDKLKKAVSVSCKAKAKKPFTIAEDLILPAALTLVEMLDKKAVEALRTVPLSAATGSRRTDDMGEDVVYQVVEKLKSSGSFALQLDESTDVSSYKDTHENAIREHILFCKTIPGRTTGDEIFNVIDGVFSEHKLDWKRCVHVCADGAASMSGRLNRLMAHIRKANPGVEWMHCILNREALASKRMSEEVHGALNDAVKVINYIQSRFANHRLFQTLWSDAESDHHQLLLHTDVRWLLFELREEVKDFLTEHSHPLAAVLEDSDWVARLAYLSDIFSKLNELNLSLQGNYDNNIYL
ncbi:hypothetical protein LDENG_00184820 [Lucifuga dentata]|nr:hypothetical protein LDENG_00184820 [Lucifuga dentata]